MNLPAPLASPSRAKTAQMGEDSGRSGDTFGHAVGSTILGHIEFGRSPATMFDEAVERIKQALEIDPLSLIVNKTMAKILYMAREYDRAVEQCLEIFELDPA